MLTLLIKSIMQFGILGGIARVLLILVCAGVVLFIVWRRKNSIFYKTCKKTRAISVLAIIVLIGITGLSVAAFANDYGFSGYATGFYSEFHQTYSQNNSIWGIECEKALTKGSFNKTITGNGSLPSCLTIESSCDSGTLILNIKQGGKVKSVDISNTNGEIQYSLSDFNNKEDLMLSVEHTTADNIRIKISW